MTTAEIHALDEKVLEVLQRSPQALTIPQIEEAVQNQFEADTFDVREAVWRLVNDRRAEFTPRRYVQVLRK